MMLSNKPNPVKSLTAIILAGFILAGCGETLTDAEYLARARDYQDKGNLQASIIELKNTLIANPDNIEARLILGGVYEKTGLGPAAEKELRRAEELGLERRVVLVPLAKALLMQGKFQEVLDLEADQSTLDDAEGAMIWALLGHAYLGLDKPEQAREAYTKSQSINASEPEASLGMARLSLDSEDLETARQWVDKALEQDPAFAAAWSLSGDLARHEANAERAEEAYGKAIAHQAWNPGDHLKRALVRIAMEKYDAAEDDIAAIRSLGGGWLASADYAQGVLLLQKQQYKEAQTAFENVLTVNSKSLESIYFLGVTHYMLGNNEQAYSYLGQYAASNPNFVSAQQLLAILEMRRGDYAAARRRISPMLILLPDDLLTLKLMSKIAMAEGDTATAIEYIQKVAAREAEEDPESALTRAHIGLGLMIEGEIERGRLQLREAIDLDKEFKVAEFALVMSLLSQDKPVEGLAAAQEFAARHPDSPMALNLLGMAQVMNEQPGEARQTFGRILEAVPGEPGAAQNLAVLALGDGDVNTAIALYEQVLEHRPGHMPTLLKLAGLKSGLGQEDEVEKLLLGVKERYPDALEPRVKLADMYIRAGKPAESIALLRDVQGKYSEHASLLSILGTAQLAEGHTANAIQNFERLVKVMPGSAEAHFKLAQAYGKAGNVEKLESSLQRALSLDPKHLSSRFAMMKLRTLQGRPDEAHTLFLALAQDYPDHPLILEEQGDQALREKRPVDAVTAYVAVLKRAPGRDILVKLALAQWQAGQGAAGIQLLERHLQVNPNDTLVRYNLANLYLLEGNQQAAQQGFAAVVASSPDHVPSLNNLAWLMRESDPGKARAYAEHAQQLAPDSWSVKDTLAMILLQQGEPGPAVELLEAAVTAAPGDRRTRYHLALALQQTGQKEQALEALRQVLDGNASFSEAADARRLLEELEAR